MLSVGYIQRTKQLKAKAIEILKTLKFRNLESGEPFIEEELLDYFIKCWKVADIDSGIQNFLGNSFQAKHFLATHWLTGFDWIHDTMAFNLYNEGYVVNQSDINFTIIPSLTLELGQDVYICYIVEREDQEGKAVYVVHYLKHEIANLMQFDLYISDSLGEDYELVI